MEQNWKLFNDMKIYQIRISDCLQHFDRIKKLYNLADYTNKNRNALFFGLYNMYDYRAIYDHNSIRYILWGGSDADARFEFPSIILKKIKNLRNTYHFAISKNIEMRLTEHKIKCTLIPFSLMDSKLFKPVKQKGGKIYIYTGYSKNSDPVIYEHEICKTVMNKLSQFEYILSNTINVPHEQMSEIYKQCFIGLRLTQNDGNANTVAEMLSMNIPVIHNGDLDSIKWTTVDDVINTILIEYEKCTHII